MGIIDERINIDWNKLVCESTVIVDKGDWALGIE